jgi:hypothetical protein
MRPLTDDDIKNIFDDLSINNLTSLLEKKKIVVVNNNSVKFYKIKES